MKAVLAATAAVLLAAAPVRAAGPYVNGTYTTPTQSGGITFKPTRAVVQYGYEGTFVVGGRSHPGSLYAVRGTGNVGLVWYYGTTGIPAGPPCSSRPAGRRTRARSPSPTAAGRSPTREP